MLRKPSRKLKCREKPEPKFIYTRSAEDSIQQRYHSILRCINSHETVRIWNTRITLLTTSFNGPKPGFWSLLSRPQLTSYGSLITFSSFTLKYEHNYFSNSVQGVIDLEAA